MTTQPDDRAATDGGFDHQHGLGTLDGNLPAVGAVRAIARTEYRLALRNRWAVALTLIFAGFSLGLLTFSGSSVGPDGIDRVLGSLAVMAVYLVPLAALAFGYDAVVGAEDDGWLQALFALPISRWQIVVGAYLGRSVALAGAVVIGFGAAGVILIRDAGLAGFHGFVAFLLGTIGLALAFLAIGLLVSTVAQEKTHALGASLLIWAWFVLVHDLLALGVIAAFDLPGVVLDAFVVTNPTGVFRVIVLSSLDAGGSSGFAAVIAATGLSTGVLLAALVAWVVLPVAVAARLISRRRV